MLLLFIEMEIAIRRTRISRGFEAVLRSVADWQGTQSHSSVRDP
jgi:hypothetical protein